MIKTIVKVRGSTNGISNKYSITLIIQLEITHKGGSNRIIIVNMITLVILFE